VQVAIQSTVTPAGTVREVPLVSVIATANVVAVFVAAFR
jgi:hypothetical protein